MTDPTAGNPASAPSEPTARADRARKPRNSTGARGDSGVPKELWNIGLVFSVFLILAGLAATAFDRTFSIGQLAVCIGFGIALTTFGTRVGGDFLKFNVVGGGAMAIALYLLLF